MNKTQKLLKEREEKLRDQVRGLIADTITYYNRYDVNFEEWDWREPIENDIKSFHTTTISLLLTSLKEEIENELEIQKKVQEKAKEVVAIGRARVAGMVADKYTRIGKIEALSDISTLLSETINNLTK